MKYAVFAALLVATAALAQNVGQTGSPYSSPLPTTNASVTIATGNTFQTILAANTIKNSITIVNNNASSSETCYITFGDGITAGNATTAKSIPLAPGGVGVYTRYSPFTPADEIEATCPTNGDTLYVDYQ